MTRRLPLILFVWLCNAVPVFAQDSENLPLVGVLRINTPDNVEPFPTIFRGTLAALGQVNHIGQFREMAQAGCLVSYGIRVSDAYVIAADLTNKMLKGARPGETPTEQPTKFDLVINLKTAKALGLTVPASLLARANEVIE